MITINSASRPVFAWTGTGGLPDDVATGECFTDPSGKLRQAMEDLPKGYVPWLEEDGHGAWRGPQGGSPAFHLQNIFADPEFRTPENISARLDQYVKDDQERQRLWDSDFSTGLQGLSVSNDGVALQAISHPAAPFWRRVWNWFFPPKLHAAALEETFLDLGNGEGLTYEGFPVPPPNNRIEEEIRRRTGMTYNDPHAPEAGQRPPGMDDA